MNTNVNIPNDFGKLNRYKYVYGRGAVEDRISIRISDLIETDEWEQRDIEELKGLRKKFKLSKIEMELMKDPLFSDWYIELVDPGPLCTDFSISLIKTKCRFGGYRYWFQCPDTDCMKKVAVLYKDGDDFKCRTCLNLDYRSHLTNYKSLEPAIKYMHEFQGMDLSFRRVYGRKNTKKMERFYKIKAKAEAGFAFFGPRYTKEK